MFKSLKGHPWGIACDRTGKVYVVDTVNNRIQVFTAEGKYLRMGSVVGELGDKSM